jgi:DNA invertase Pin-like site-specific DNA recombinase
MIRGYARVSTDGQSVDAQVRQLKTAGAEKISRETASGAKTDRTQLCRVLDQLDAGDVLLVTRLDRLARSTRDLIRARTSEGRARAVANGVRLGRKPTLTPHQRREAIKRVNAGKETLGEIARDSLGPDACRFNNWPPFFDFGLVESPECLRHLLVARW